VIFKAKMRTRHAQQLGAERAL